MKINRSLLVSLLGGSLLLAFVIFQYSIDCNYRLSADDFSGVDYAKDGIPGLGYAWKSYWGWEGTFLNKVLQGLSMWFIGLGVPIGIVLGSIKLAIAGSNYVLLGALNKKFNLDWSKSDRLLAASVFIITLYLISPDQSELWHWAIGTSSSYMFSLSFLQLAAALILSDRVLWALIPLSFVAQSRATYAPLVFGLLFIISVWTCKRGDKKCKQWALLSVGFLIFMALYFIAPGNYVRLGSPSYEFDQWLYEYWKGVRNLFVTYNLSKVDTILLSLLVIIPAVLDREAGLQPIKKWVYAIPLILYGIFGIGHELLFVTLTGYCEWTRVLSLHVFLFYSMVLIYGFWFLPKLVVKAGRFKVASGVNLLQLQILGHMHV